MRASGTPTSSTSAGGPGDIASIATNRRTRRRIGAAAVLWSASMIVACGGNGEPLSPQPAAAAERPISPCPAVSFVPNAQYGPLLHRQDPGFNTPPNIGLHEPVPVRPGSVPRCQSGAATTEQVSIAPNPGVGPLQHRLDR